MRLKLIKLQGDITRLQAERDRVVQERVETMVREGIALGETWGLWEKMSYIIRS